MACHGSGWVGSLISQLCHIPGQWHQGKNVLGRESIDGESWLISWLTVWWSDVLIIWCSDGLMFWWSDGLMVWCSDGLMFWWSDVLWSDVLMIWGLRSEVRGQSLKAESDTFYTWHLDSKCKQGLNCIWKQTWQFWCTVSVHHCHIPEDIGKGRVFPTRFSLYSSSRVASSHWGGRVTGGNYRHLRFLLQPVPTDKCVAMYCNILLAELDMQWILPNVSYM